MNVHEKLYLPLSGLMWWPRRRKPRQLTNIYKPIRMTFGPRCLTFCFYAVMKNFKLQSNALNPASSVRENEIVFIFVDYMRKVSYLFKRKKFWFALIDHPFGGRKARFWGLPILDHLTSSTINLIYSQVKQCVETHLTASVSVPQRTLLIVCYQNSVNIQKSSTASQGLFHLTYETSKKRWHNDRHF